MPAINGFFSFYKPDLLLDFAFSVTLNVTGKESILGMKLGCKPNSISKM